MIIHCFYWRWYSVMFTGSNVLLCLQEVIFWCVYRQWYSDVFTGGNVLSCLQVEIFWCFQAVIDWCVYRRWCFVMLTGGDILVYLWQWCFVYLWRYSVVFTGSNVFFVFTGGGILVCLQAVIVWCVYRRWCFVMFTGWDNLVYLRQWCDDTLLCLQAAMLCWV